MRYFRSAARTENFSQTAAEFIVPQSTVSQTIKKLECELGVQLFDRRGNRVYLNQNGRLFQRAVDNGLLQIDETVERLKKLETDRQQTVSLLINTDRRFIAECITLFKTQYPDVCFNIHHNLPAGLEPGRFDMIVDEDNSRYDGMRRQLLIRERMLLGVPQNHPLAHKKKIVFADIESEPFISMPAGSSLHRMLDGYFACHQKTPRIDIYCDDPYYIRKYIKIYMGIAVWPEFSWLDMAQEDIRLVSLADDPWVRSIYLYTADKALLNDAANCFSHFVMEQAENAVKKA